MSKVLLKRCLPWPSGLIVAGFVVILLRIAEFAVAAGFHVLTRVNMPHLTQFFMETWDGR